MLRGMLDNAGDLGLGRSPGEENGNPIQYSFWRIPWTEESGGLQTMGLDRVEDDLVTTRTTANIPLYICTAFS